MTHRTLVVMAKAPVAGAVKTRLAAVVGVAEATRFYRVSVGRLVRRLSRDARWHTVLAVTPDSAVGSRLLPPGPRRVAQGGGDLGRRMQRMFDRARPGPTVIIGSDIPGISVRQVDAAFRQLGRHDAVFGPAEDGGYWLVGLKGRPAVPRIFAGVRWSTPNALADTLANCSKLSVGLLSPLADVDDAGAWRQWRRREG